MEIINKSVEKIIPYKNNPRCNDNAVDAVSKSIKEFGFKVPIVINSDNVIVTGHTRLKAAKKLGMEEVPCVVADDLSDEQLKAFRLADNKTAELASWDLELLESELDGILDIDMSEFGFELTDDELPTEDFEDENAEQDFTDEENEKINAAWREYAGEYCEQYDIMKEHRYTFSGISKGLAKVKFLETKYLGHKYPRYLSLAFHPMQFMTKGAGLSVYEGLQKVYRGEINAERLRYVCSDKSLINLYRGTLCFNDARMPLDFPVELARELIRRYSNKGNVLDPCHGWGGRLIGAMLENVKEYHGFDPSPYQHEGVCEIFETFKDYAETDAKIEMLPFEKAELQDNYYDFAMTSPPYFDVEQYIGGEQSHENYDNYNKWRDGFYTKLIHKTYAALKDNAVFALQVGSQSYPLKDDGIRIAKEIGFTFEEVLNTDMTNPFNGTDEEHAEIVIILRK